MGVSIVLLAYGTRRSTRNKNPIPEGYRKSIWLRAVGDAARNKLVESSIARETSCKYEFRLVTDQQTLLNSGNRRVG